ncbi:MAG: hypothetical protein ACRDD1_01390, partial [Planctomycetia bacterium]
MKPHVGVMVVEVSTPAEAEPWTLDLVLQIQSKFRMIYPPYFIPRGDAKPEIGGNCPTEVVFETVGGGTITSDFQAGRARFAETVHRTHEPPVAAHWKELLKPIEAEWAAVAPMSGKRLRLRQILDDRIPSMSYLAVDDPRTISEGDMYRLAYCDEPSSNPYPFCEEFLRREYPKFAYDRYWRRSPDQDAPAVDGMKLNTRYLCSGFHFSVVGAEGNWYFRNILIDHFRRHYFRMGLAVHYQRAALLKFEDEFANAISHLSECRDDPQDELKNLPFRLRVGAIRATFLKFASRSWFTEASNQLQGQELFTWWSGLLRNGELFQMVADGGAALHAEVTVQEERQIAEAQTKLTQSQTDLAALVQWGLLISIGFSVAATAFSWFGL